MKEELFSLKVSLSFRLQAKEKHPLSSPSGFMPMKKSCEIVRNNLTVDLNILSFSNFII